MKNKRKRAVVFVTALTAFIAVIATACFFAFGENKYHANEGEDVVVNGGVATITAQLKHTQDSQITIHEPKTVIFDGDTGKSNFLVGVSGEMGSQDKMNVDCKTDVNIMNKLFEEQPLTVTQNKTEVTREDGLMGEWYDEMSSEVGNFVTGRNYGVVGGWREHEGAPNDQIWKTYRKAKYTDQISDTDNRTWEELLATQDYMLEDRYLADVELKFKSQPRNEKGFPYWKIENAPNTSWRYEWGSTSAANNNIVTDGVGVGYWYLYSDLTPAMQNPAGEYCPKWQRHWSFEEIPFGQWYIGGHIGWNDYDWISLELQPYIRLAKDFYIRPTTVTMAIYKNVHWFIHMPRVNPETKEAVMFGTGHMTSFAEYSCYSTYICSSVFGGDSYNAQLDFGGKTHGTSIGGGKLWVDGKPAYWEGSNPDFPVCDDIKSNANVAYNFLFAADYFYIDYGDYVLRVDLNGGASTVLLKCEAETETAAGEWHSQDAAVSYEFEGDVTLPETKAGDYTVEASAESEDINNQKYYVDIPRTVTLDNNGHAEFRLGIKLDENNTMPIAFEVETASTVTLQNANQSYRVTLTPDRSYIPATEPNSDGYVYINYTVDEQTVSGYDWKFNAGTYQVDFDVKITPTTHIMSNEMFTWDGTTVTGLTALGVAALQENGGILDLPEKATAIGANAFQNRTDVREVRLGNVSSVGNYAFDNVKSLETVDFGRTLTTIGGYVFRNCTGLTEIDLPDTLTSIGNYAFAGCNGLTELTNLPNSLKTIGSYAFHNCKGLTEAIIPDSVTSLGTFAFYGSNNLESVTIGTGITVISQGAFYLTGLTSIEIPSNVTTLNGGCFRETKLTSVVIPDTVTKVEHDLFRDCKELESVTIGTGLKALGDADFYGCIKLTDIVIPDNITKLGTSCFENCKSLKSIHVPESVTTWGGALFRYCTSLETVTWGTDGLWSSSGEQFRGCTSLTNITLAPTIKTIQNGVFYDCTSLTSLNFEDCTNLTTINNDAFGNTPITEFDFSNTTETLALKASTFSRLKEGSTVKLPPDVTVSGDVLYNSKNLNLWLYMYNEDMSVTDEYTYFNRQKQTTTQIATLNPYDYSVVGDLSFGYCRAEDNGWITGCAQDTLLYDAPDVLATLGVYENVPVRHVAPSVFTSSFLVIPYSMKDDYIIEENNNVIYKDGDNLVDENGDIIAVKINDSILNADINADVAAQDSGVNKIFYTDACVDIEDGVATNITTTLKYTENGQFFVDYMKNNNLPKIDLYDQILTKSDEGEIFANYRVRYVRVGMGRSDANSGVHIREFTAVDNDGTNVALKKSVNGGNYTNMNDGSTGNYYTLGDASQTNYLTATVDLGEIFTTLDYFNLVPIENRTYFPIIVEVSTNNSDWVTAYDSRINGDAYRATLNGLDIPAERKVYPVDAAPEPIPYRQVEYIDMPNTAYFETGYLPLNHYVEIDFQSNVQYAIFGTLSGGAYFHFHPYQNKYFYGQNGSEANAGSFTTGRHFVQYNYGDNHEVIVDGTVIGSGNNISVLNSGRSLQLGRRSGATNGAYKLYSFKLVSRNTGDVLLDCIPALDDNDVPCLFDKVSNSFKYFVGTVGYGGDVFWQNVNVVNGSVFDETRTMNEILGDSEIRVACYNDGYFTENVNARISFGSDEVRSRGITRQGIDNVFAYVDEIVFKDFTLRKENGEYSVELQTHDADFIGWLFETLPFTEIVDGSMTYTKVSGEVYAVTQSISRDGLDTWLSGQKNNGTSFDTNQGNTWIDLTDNHNNAFVAGASETPTSWIDNALRFNVKNSYRWGVNNITKTTPTKTMFVTCRIPTDFVPVNSGNWYACSCLFGTELGGTHYDYGLLIDRNGKFAFGHCTSTVTTSGVTALDNEVHTVCGVYTQSGIKLYVDGVLTVQTNCNHGGSHISWFGLGWNAAGTDTRIKGDIFDVQIYSKALSADEIKAISSDSKLRYDYNLTSANSYVQQKCAMHEETPENEAKYAEIGVDIVYYTDGVWYMKDSLSPDKIRKVFDDNPTYDYILTADGLSVRQNNNIASYTQSELEALFNEYVLVSMTDAVIKDENGQWTAWVDFDDETDILALFNAFPSLQTVYDSNAGVYRRVGDTIEKD